MRRALPGEMPPKKQAGPNKKTVEKKKDKVIEVNNCCAIEGLTHLLHHVVCSYRPSRGI